MGTNIVLPALDGAPRPLPVAAQTPLQEFEQASALKSQAGQQQIQQQQATALSQQNQMAAMQLKDEQLRRQLAPQFVQKDADGKPTGFDSDGLYNSMLQQGADPLTIQNMRMKQVEFQKSLIGLSDAQSARLEKVHDAMYDAIQSVEGVQNKTYKPAAAAPTIPNASGVPSFMLPNASPSQGGPEQAAPPEPPVGQRPLTPEAQAAYHQQLMQLAQNGVPIGGMRPQIHNEAELEQSKAELGLYKQAQNNAAREATTAEAVNKGKQAAAEAAKAEWIGSDGIFTNIRTGQVIHSGGSPTLQAFQEYVGKGGDPLTFAAHQAQQEAAVTQPYRIQTAMAEGKARQLIQGMGESVYAFTPDGNRTLMSKTEALQTPGVKAMVPVTEKAIGDDILLNNRLTDVNQKINQYEQSLNGIGSTISAKDQSNIAAIMGKQAFRIGAFGTEVPVDRLNAALDKENIKGLSDDAIKTLAAYYNARESLVGYNRVLSGSARGGEKQMELSLDTLPNPGTADARYAKESINQFKQNLQIVGQGIPIIPGVARPEQWQQAHPLNQTQPAANPVGALKIGQPATVRGKQMTVTAVHPDGSFDAK